MANFEKVDFGAIVKTAYQEFAIRAFRFSAIDYRLKPIDPDELQAVVEKFKSQVARVNPQQLRILHEHLDSTQSPGLIERKEMTTSPLPYPPPRTFTLCR